MSPNTDEVEKVLSQKGITRGLAKRALKIAQRHGDLTIFALVDALTTIASEIKFAGARLEADQKAARLLELAVAS